MQGPPINGLRLHFEIAPLPSRVTSVEVVTHSQLLVKDGQLFIELALGLRKFVEPRPSLGVGGVLTQCWLRVRAARGRCHADVALTRGVVLPRSRCPPERRGSRQGAGHMQVVDVGHHRVVRQAGLSRGYITVYHSMNSPNKRLSSACLKARSVR
jgi:hypothetical protein